MANSREEFGRRTHYGDEFGNPVNQPTTIAAYAHPCSTDDHQAYNTPKTVTGGQQRLLPAEVGDDYDPTQRRRTTTGEYGVSGIGFVDGAKEKLAGIGGFKEDPGHTTTTSATAAGGGGGEEDGGGAMGLVEKIKEKVT